ncbi:MAG TPA: heme o synthase [Chlamydiales bacterium]|nr:heme o synthase [Chlamydiales bacterium]
MTAYSFTVRSYALLTKPGILLGNAITILGGFFLASRGSIDFKLLLITVVGLSLIIASSCVFNNAIDRKADSKMDRTKHRPLVTGSIALYKALFFALLLVGLGIWILAFTNYIALFIALFGFFVYVLLYSFSKYYSVHGTLIGSLAGAVPPVVGYCAVSGQLDLGAWILFAILTIWQMPHFYAIAIFRKNDYAKASIPVLPIVKGIPTTKIHMLIYTIVFLAVAPLLTFFGYTGYGYLVVSILLSLGWVRLAIQGFRVQDNIKWARKMFGFSLLVITLLSIAMMVDYT